MTTAKIYMSHIYIYISLLGFFGQKRILNNNNLNSNPYQIRKRIYIIIYLTITVTITVM